MRVDAEGFAEEFDEYRRWRSWIAEGEVEGMDEGICGTAERGREEKLGHRQVRVTKVFIPCFVKVLGSFDSGWG